MHAHLKSRNRKVFQQVRCNIYLEGDVALLHGDAEAPEFGIVGEEALLEAARVGLDLRVGEAQGEEDVGPRLRWSTTASL